MVHIRISTRGKLIAISSATENLYFDYTGIPIKKLCQTSIEHQQSISYISTQGKIIVSFWYNDEGIISKCVPGDAKNFATISIEP